MTEQEISRLARELGVLLLARGETLAAAESCTGGWVGQAITSVPGSSGWFEAGFVTYSNAAKERLLGVSPQTLQEHGAVSSETAVEMAAGALERGQTDWSLAVTGIAGPGGGTPTRPAGTVLFAWLSRNGLSATEAMRFAGDRHAVRMQSVAHALEGLLKRLRKGSQD